MVRRSRLGRFVALAVCLVVVLGACSVDATVTVKVRDDGSGYVQADVTADAEAVQAAEVGGGKLEDRVRLSDLPDAGWTVEPWVRNPDGSASVSLRKPFSDVDEIPGILRELNGEFGPLQSAAFARSRSFFSTQYTATGEIDLGAIGTGIADDAELVQRLQAQGVDVAGVDAQLLDQLQRAFSMRLVVELPGRAPVTIEPAAGAAAPIDVSSSVQDTRRVTFVAIAGFLLVLAMIVAVWPRKRRRRGRGRRRTRARSREVIHLHQGEVDPNATNATPTRRGTPPAT
jgi:hypothetical protein